MFRPLIDAFLALPINRRLIVAGVVSVTGATCLLLLIMWRMDASHTAARLAVLELRLTTFIAEYQAKDEALKEELSGIYRTLYAAPEIKSPPRRPLVIEAWQQNVIKDLQAKVSRLEQWRLRAER